MKFSLHEERNVIHASLFTSFLASVLFTLVSSCFGQLVILFDFHNHYNRSRDSSVDITTGYGLEGRGSILDRSKIFSVIHSVQTGTKTRPACYPVDPGDSFPGGKAAGA
jgi:hypothetical protein